MNKSVYVLVITIFICIFQFSYLPLKYQQETIYKTYIPVVYSPINKFGISGGNNQMAQVIGASWFYAWNPIVDISGVEGVAMMRDGTSINNIVIDNSNYLLGFNEPDVCPNQACITPANAAILWHIIEERFPNKKLVSPATSHNTPTWLIQFRDEYYKLYQKYPRLDALAFHCYYNNANQCIEYGKQIITLAKEWEIPEVWCTEFSFLKALNVNYIKEIEDFITWLEYEPIITHYSPYVTYNGECPSLWWNDCRTDANPSLFEKDLVTLTELGKLYKGIWESNNNKLLQ